MTKKDFFRVIIKIISLYLLINALLVPLSMLFVIQQNTDYALSMCAYSFAVILLLLFFIYRADSIIKWLRLDKGYDNDNIEITHFTPKHILQLASIIIGGLLVVNNFVTVITDIIYAFKFAVGNDTIGQYYTTENGINFTLALIKTVLGYFLIAYSNKVAGLLQMTRNKNKNV